MDKVKQLTQVLYASIENKSYTESDIAYNVLYADALSHSVHTVVFNAVRKQSDVYVGKKAKIIAFSADYLRKTENALKIFSDLCDTGVDAVAVKGLALQSLYPSPDLRIMNDVDIVLKNSRDIEKVKGFFTKRGYDFKATADNVVNFTKENELSFEIHTFVKLQRYIKKGSSGADKIIDVTNSETINVGKHKIKVLKPTEHFIYIIGHMGTHFSAGGIGFRQLCDTWLFAREHNLEIDWQGFWRAMDNLGYIGFAANLMYICEKEFSLNTDVIFKALKEKPKNCADELLFDIYEAGVFGQKNKEQKYGRIVSTGGGSLLKAIFPAYMEEEKYSYAMRKRYLLPIAWIHRGFDFVINKFSIKDFEHMSKAKEISRRRVDLFDKLGM